MPDYAISLAIFHFAKAFLSMMIFFADTLLFSLCLMLIISPLFRLLWLILCHIISLRRWYADAFADDDDCCHYIFHYFRAIAAADATPAPLFSYCFAAFLLRLPPLRHYYFIDFITLIISIIFDGLLIYWRQPTAAFAPPFYFLHYAAALCCFARYAAFSLHYFFSMLLIFVISLLLRGFIISLLLLPLARRLFSLPLYYYRHFRHFSFIIYHISLPPFHYLRHYMPPFHYAIHGFRWCLCRHFFMPPPFSFSQPLIIDIFRAYYYYYVTHYHYDIISPLFITRLLILFVTLFSPSLYARHYWHYDALIIIISPSFSPLMPLVFIIFMTLREPPLRHISFLSLHYLRFSRHADIDYYASHWWCRLRAFFWCWLSFFIFAADADAALFHYFRRCADAFFAALFHYFFIIHYWCRCFDYLMPLADAALLDMTLSFSFTLIIDAMLLPWCWYFAMLIFSLRYFAILFSLSAIIFDATPHCRFCWLPFFRCLRLPIDYYFHYFAAIFRWCLYYALDAMPPFLDFRYAIIFCFRHCLLMPLIFAAFHHFHYWLSLMLLMPFAESGFAICWYADAAFALCWWRWYRCHYLMITIITLLPLMLPRWLCLRYMPLPPLDTITLLMLMPMLSLSFAIRLIIDCFHFLLLIFHAFFSLSHFNIFIFIYFQHLFIISPRYFHFPLSFFIIIFSIITLSFSSSFHYWWCHYSWLRLMPIISMLLLIDIFADYAAMPLMFYRHTPDADYCHAADALFADYFATLFLRLFHFLMMFFAIDDAFLHFRLFSPYAIILRLFIAATLIYAFLLSIICRDVTLPRLFSMRFIRDILLMIFSLLMPPLIIAAASADEHHFSSFSPLFTLMPCFRHAFDYLHHFFAAYAWLFFFFFSPRHCFAAAIPLYYWYAIFVTMPCQTFRHYFHAISRFSILSSLLLIILFIDIDAVCHYWCFIRYAFIAFSLSFRCFHYIISIFHYYWLFSIDIAVTLFLIRRLSFSICWYFATLRFSLVCCQGYYATFRWLFSSSH